MARVSPSPRQHQPRRRFGSVDGPDVNTVPPSPEYDFQTPFGLGVVAGPHDPMWDDPFPLWNDPAPKENEQETGAAPVSYAQLASDLIYRAPVAPVPTEDQLSQPPPPRGFLEADGMQLDEGGMSVIHSFFKESRQAVLSSDWVHIDHKLPVGQWVVRATEASWEYGDIYFGVTESNGFTHRGRSIAYDVRGNSRVGWTPTHLPIMNRATNEDFNGGRYAAIRISVELAGPDEKKKLVLELLTSGQERGEKVDPRGAAIARIEHPIPSWRCARLFVSVNCPRDTVELVK